MSNHLYSISGLEYVYFKCSLESVAAVEHACRVRLELVHTVGVVALDLAIGDAVGSVRGNVVIAERRAICGESQRVHFRFKMIAFAENEPLDRILATVLR